MSRKRGKRPNRRLRRLAANQPSTYIRSFDSIQPGDKVRLCCRVSTHAQYANGNLADQEAELRTAVEAIGGIVTDVEPHVGTADADAADAWRYGAANRAAREGAVLLAESPNRFARTELRNLRWICGDVPLVTLHDPDIGRREERGIQSKRGQQHKGNKGGRPIKNPPGYKKEKRLKALPELRRMKLAGMSNRAIARALKTDERNVRRWAAAFL